MNGGGPCMYCGLNPAAGYASIATVGEIKWYCHDDEKPSCYEKVQRGYDERR